MDNSMPTSSRLGGQTRGSFNPHAFYPIPKNFFLGVWMIYYSTLSLFLMLFLLTANRFPTWILQMIRLFFALEDESLSKLKSLLDDFQAASGQRINSTKSSFVVSSKASTQQISAIHSLLGFNRKNLPILYVGCPLYKGRSKKSYFAPLLEKIRKKISRWQFKFLSQARRLILLKSVLTSILLHLLHSLSPPL
jgi:hypothetical protein